MESLVEYGNLDGKALYKHWMAQLEPLLSRRIMFFRGIQVTATGKLTGILPMMWSAFVGIHLVWATVVLICTYFLYVYTSYSWPLVQPRAQEPFWKTRGCRHKLITVWLLSSEHLMRIWWNHKPLHDVSYFNIDNYLLIGKQTWQLTKADMG